MMFTTPETGRRWIHVTTMLVAVLGVIVLGVGTAQAQWTTDGNNNIYYNSGTVAIGTTPSGNFKFEVAGYGNVGTGAKVGVISIARSGGDYDSIGYNFRPTATAGLYKYDLGDTSSRIEFTAGGFKFKTAPTGSGGNTITYSDAMTILQGGNVGIGTSPSTKFHLKLGSTYDSLTIEEFANGRQLRIVAPNGTSGATHFRNTFTGADFVWERNPAGDGSTFVEDMRLSGGKLGIGTIPSASRLQVVDSVSGFTHQKSAGGYFTSLGFNGNNPYLTYYSAAGLTIGYGSVTGGAPSVNTMTLTNAGSVGIGTTNPSASKLQVVDSGSGFTHEKSAGGYFTALGFNGNNPYLTYYSAAGLTIGYGAVTGGAPSVSTMTLTNAGNVGIGTTDPGTYKLNVSGTINASELRINGSPIANWASSGSDFYSTGSVGVGAAPGGNYKFQVHGVGAGSGAKFGGALNIARSTGDYDSIGYNFRGTDTGGTYKYDLNDTSSRLEFHLGGFKFKTAPSGIAGNDIGYSDAMTIEQSGKVGIGTTSPSTRFHLKLGSTYDSLTIEEFANGRQLRIVAPNGTSGATHFRNTFTGADFVWERNPAGDGSTFVEDMRLSGGKLGIGTYLPGYKLDVLGSNSIQARFGNTADNGLFLMGLNNSAYVNAGASFNGSNWIAKNSTAATIFEQDGGNFNFYSNTSGLISDGSFSPIQIVKFAANGRVGIGTTSPASKLHIYNVGSSDAALSINGNDPVNANLSLVNTNGNTFTLTAGIPGVTNSNFSIGQGSTSHLVIANGSGNVGIGTTDPGTYKLNVNGTINASELRINGSPIASWASSGSDFYSTGSVGVGAAPGGNYKFQVHGVGAGSGAKFGGALNIARSTGDYDSVGYNFRGTDIGGTYKYDLNDTSSRLEFHLGGFKFKTAPSGIGGSDIVYSDAMTIEQSGKVGIGTTTPSEKVDIVGHLSLSGGAKEIRFKNASGNTEQYVWHSGTSLGMGAGSETNSMFVTGGGNVGIGTTTPGYKLEVNGNTNVNGNITASGSIAAKYQDVAEWVPSSEQLSAGTVVVLDSTKSNQVISSSQSYDTRVAGVISAQPGIVLGEKSDDRVLVATTGRVKVKVDASKGSIHIGDLLVTSDIPGVAMKSVAVNLGGVQFHRPGTLIGKALEPLEKGSGEILVLLSLQ